MCVCVCIYHRNDKTGRTRLLKKVFIRQISPIQSDIYIISLQLTKLKPRLDLYIYIYIYIYIYSSLTSALDGGVWSTPRPGRQDPIPTVYEAG